MSLGRIDTQALTRLHRIERSLELREQLHRIGESLATRTQDHDRKVEPLKRLLIGQVVVRCYEQIEVILSSAQQCTIL